jgi:hypothetical protein
MPDKGFTRRLQHLQRFRRRPQTDRRLAMFAAVLVATLRLALWILPLRVVLERVSLLADTARPPESTPRCPKPDTLAWAVAATSRYIPRATCLTQALALQVLLGRYGYPSRLQLGMRRDESGVLQAHAWVERDGRPVAGGPDVDGFHRFPDFRPLLGSGADKSP